MMRVSLSLLLVASSSAFTANVHTVRHLAPLHVGATWDWNNDESFYLQEQAESCASSDSCSLEDARVCLDNMIRIQSDCSSGSLVGSKVCEDVSDAAAIVGSLREKIDTQSKRMSAIMAGTTAINISLGLVFLAVCMTGLTYNDPNVASFTAQEWWWSIRDGYLPMMLKEYYQSGGLATAQSEATPFTMQEVVWAVKGGYLDTLAAHYFRNGGLAMEEQLVASAPFTPQEWFSALQGGYLDQILSQTFMNGGLTDVASDMDTPLPVTPQELVWAAQGNYLDTLTKSYIQNGGI